jgi:hypothetical protein
MTGIIQVEMADRSSTTHKLSDACTSVTVDRSAEINLTAGFFRNSSTPGNIGIGEGSLASARALSPSDRSSEGWYSVSHSKRHNHFACPFFDY